MIARSNTLVKSEQFRNGKEVEAFLDNHFERQGFLIWQTTPRQERVEHLGDRRFEKGDRAFYVEYKSGIQTFYTGNIFLETISVDDPANYKRGWVYTCQADYILYACLLNGLILVFKPDKLRDKIEGLKRQFREVKTSNNQNPGYDTHGVIVPLGYAKEHLAEKTIRIHL